MHMLAALQLDRVLNLAFPVVSLVCAVILFARIRSSGSPMMLGAIGFLLIAGLSAFWTVFISFMPSVGPSAMNFVSSISMVVQYAAWILILVMFCQAPIAVRNPPPIRQPLPPHFHLICPVCGQVNQARVLVCGWCQKGLRPTLLEIITLLAIAAPIVLLPSILRKPDLPGLIQLIVLALSAMLALGLRYRQYWAWILIQVACCLNLAVMGALAYFTPHPRFLAVASVQAILIVLFWVYLYSDRVKRFCMAAVRDERILE